MCAGYSLWLCCSHITDFSCKGDIMIFPAFLSRVFIQWKFFLGKYSAWRLHISLIHQKFFLFVCFLFKKKINPDDYILLVDSWNHFSNLLNLFFVMEFDGSPSEQHLETELIPTFSKFTILMLHIKDSYHRWVHGFLLSYIVVLKYI